MLRPARRALGLATKSGEQKSDNPLAMLQQGMKFFLRLEHQLEVVDYGKANFIHADLSPEGMRRAMKERGDDEMTVFRASPRRHLPWSTGPA